MSKRPCISDDGQDGRINQPTKKIQTQDLRDRSFRFSFCITPWRSSEISEDLPPLPAIRDQNLEELVFTHPGCSPAGNPNAHYEMLEWIGDAWLEILATELIARTFLHLPSGRCSQMRERLVKNTTLAKYFELYSLQSRAILPIELAERTDPGRGTSADKDLLKTRSDMFEAYVAAVIRDDPENGMQTAVNWLKALWGRSIKDEVKRAESSNNEATNKRSPKDELAARIVVPGVRIRYEKAGKKDKKDKHVNQQRFFVSAYLDGWGEKDKFLGGGSALSVKEAGQKAAEEALRNRKLLQGLEAKKKAFLDAREKAAALE